MHIYFVCFSDYTTDNAGVCVNTFLTNICLHAVACVTHTKDTQAPRHSRPSASPSSPQQLPKQTRLQRSFQPRTQSVCLGQTSQAWLAKTTQM